ncbi:uncharacterized protein LOC121407729 isoform X2 [Lytechinus variegatus]|uniref:uncharacterized protein LOC121407729 isoform X2 n=1 Tax=Lytechinus variegatus TaxID=7654 RepID=UPI001BB26AFA|nr:uncharacterized protein LOC121407729 isoform X2 [Lytechinus variegatus]
MSVQKAPNDKFFYFCYASNLLKSRFHLYVPSAEFVSPAKLEDPLPILFTGNHSNNPRGPRLLMPHLPHGTGLGAGQ